uniref:Uncharacterized protein n=1 Tax=Arcella intermedia TaxID=1963864 RepID=A0A6B2LVC8_9EUKA
MICELLKSNSSLLNLSLQKNYIGTAGANFLSQALRIN